MRVRPAYLPDQDDVQAVEQAIMSQAAVMNGPAVAYIMGIDQNGFMVPNIVGRDYTMMDRLEQACIRVLRCRQAIDRIPEEGFEGIAAAPVYYRHRFAGAVAVQSADPDTAAQLAALGAEVLGGAELRLGKSEVDESVASSGRGGLSMISLARLAADMRQGNVVRALQTVLTQAGRDDRAGDWLLRGLKHDGLAGQRQRIARVIVQNPELVHPKVVAWAQTVLEESS